MTDVLVTGAAGFVGRHLTGSLGSQYDVIALAREQGDVENASTWDELPPAAAVVHLAGLNFVPDSWNRPAAYLASNLLGVTHALDYCRRHGARLIYVSSYLYGRPDQLPVAETAPVRVLNPYGLSKHLAEKTCQFYAENLGVQVTVLRPFNIFGPNQNPNFLIPSVIDQALYGEEIVVQDLAPRRDYLYVADFVAAIQAALERSFDYACFNIGSGVSHSVGEVVDIVMRAAGRQVPVISRDVRRPNEVLDLFADTTLARAQLNWSPRWTLAEGCTAIINDLRASASHERAQ